MRRRVYAPRDWELRDDPRFEELDSDEDDEGDRQGVDLDPNSYALRSRNDRRFVSDELYFDGYDIGQDHRGSRRNGYDQYGQELDYHSDEEASGHHRDQRAVAYQGIRDKEEALIQSALARIARARAKGKTNVDLSKEEMEALERRTGQQPESSPPPMLTALASPPATPAKTPKGKVGSRSNSSTNLARQKPGKKNGSGGLFGTNAPSPAKSNSKAKVNRKPSAEQALPYPTGQAPPGIMVPGPNGVQIYAPIGYHGPPSPEISRGSSRPGSRSASKHSRRESTPPEQYPPRIYYPPPSSSVRPESSGSNRSLPDDIDWYPPPLPQLPSARARAASNNAPSYYADYDGQSLPAAQGGRRNVSGPPDVRYASLRRVPPSSPLARPAAPHASLSDPAVSGRRARGSGLSRAVDDRASSPSSASSSDDQGVQVEILPDDRPGGGYQIHRVPAAVPVAMGGGSGNEGRRRKGGGGRR